MVTENGHPAESEPTPLPIDEPRNIVITGFMGTGKSTVGSLVADAIGWSFVDADDEIESRTGRIIADIFAEDGEAAFRRIESVVCQSLAARTQVVIATGGGMLLDERNRTVMLASGMVVCLRADPDELALRLADEIDQRPLLKGDWRALYAQRQPIYDSLPFQVETTGKTPQEVALEIVWLWRSLSL